MVCGCMWFEVGFSFIPMTNLLHFSINYSIPPPPPLANRVTQNAACSYWLALPHPLHSFDLSFLFSQLTASWTLSVLNQRLILLLWVSSQICHHLLKRLKCPHILHKVTMPAELTHMANEEKTHCEWWCSFKQARAISESLHYTLHFLI